MGCRFTFAGRHGWPSSEQLRGLEIVAEDRPIGSLEDVYFDHEDWRLRHAVVFTGAWLSGRWIVLPVPVLRDIDPARRILRAATVRSRIGASPAPETDRPISRAFEKALYSHYGCAPYWQPPPADLAGTGRSHLLSAEELKGYHVEARDGEVGRLEDYLVEEEDWGIRYLSLATRRWLPGRRVAAPAEWIHLVNWKHRRIVLRHFREDIRHSPAFAGPGSLSWKRLSTHRKGHRSGRGEGPVHRSASRFRPLRRAWKPPGRYIP